MKDLVIAFYRQENILRGEGENELLLRMIFFLMKREMHVK
jgi:hypothetical protein